MTGLKIAMSDDLTRVGPVMLLIGLFALAAVTGCGGDGSASDGWWGEIVMIDMNRGRLSGDQNSRNQTQRDRAVIEETEKVLQDYSGRMPADLQRVLETIRDETRQLADNEVTGADAEAMREKHEQYWAHLRRQEIPTLP